MLLVKLSSEANLTNPLVQNANAPVLGVDAILLHPKNCANFSCTLN